MSCCGREHGGHGKKRIQSLRGFSLNNLLYLPPPLVLSLLINERGISLAMTGVWSSDLSIGGCMCSRGGVKAIKTLLADDLEQVLLMPLAALQPSADLPL